MASSAVLHDDAAARLIASAGLDPQTLARANTLLPIDGGDGPDQLLVLSITMATIGAVRGAQPGLGVTFRGTWLQGDYDGPFTIAVTAGSPSRPRSGTSAGPCWSASTRPTLSLSLRASRTPPRGR